MRQIWDESPWIEIEIALLAVADAALFGFLIYVLCTLTTFLNDFLPRLHAALTW